MDPVGVTERAEPTPLTPFTRAAVTEADAITEETGVVEAEARARRPPAAAEEETGVLLPAAADRAAPLAAAAAAAARSADPLMVIAPLTLQKKR